MKTCFVCDCTEQRACHGGCAWYSPGLCTSCVAKALEPDQGRALALCVIEYDTAIRECFDDPELMSSFTTAEGEDLDALYFAFTTRARVLLHHKQIEARIGASALAALGRDYAINFTSIAPAGAKPGDPPQ